MAIELHRQTRHLVRGTGLKAPLSLKPSRYESIKARLNRLRKDDSHSDSNTDSGRARLQSCRKSPNIFRALAASEAVPSPNLRPSVVLHLVIYQQKMSHWPGNSDLCKGKPLISVFPLICPRNPQTLPASNPR